MLLGVSLILYGGVNVLGGGMCVWRWGFWTTGTVFSGDPHSPPVTFGVNETVKTVTTKALNDIMVSPLIFTDFSKLV